MSRKCRLVLQNIYQHINFLSANQRTACFILRRTVDYSTHCRYSFDCKIKSYRFSCRPQLPITNLVDASSGWIYRLSFISVYSCTEYRRAHQKINSAISVSLPHMGPVSQVLKISAGSPQTEMLKILHQMELKALFLINSILLHKICSKNPMNGEFSIRNLLLHSRLQKSRRRFQLKQINVTFCSIGWEN